MLLGHVWIAKAIVQSVVCKLGLIRAYYKGQQKVGRLNDFHPLTRSEYAAKLHADIADFARLDGASIVEIGTGWVPVVPLLLHAMGARNIVTFDLNRHLQADLTMRAIGLLPECLSDIHRRTGVDTGPMLDRLNRLASAKSLTQALSMANIDYRAPADASKSWLPRKSVDILYSNLVLEHIPVEPLKAIHLEARRILAPGGVCWHNIDYSDHYAATHSGLSEINFLRYSRRFWERVGNNDILYQNRLRRSAHLGLMQECGFEVLKCVDHHSPSAQVALATGFSAHPEFGALAEQDLLVSASRVVIRPAAQ